MFCLWRKKEKRVLILSLLLLKALRRWGKCHGRIAAEKVDKDQISFALALTLMIKILQITVNETYILIISHTKNIDGEGDDDDDSECGKDDGGDGAGDEDKVGDNNEDKVVKIMAVKVVKVMFFSAKSYNI